MCGVKVSIVIPVYNIPDRILRQCIESAIHQTLREIEIILVDDGSTDHSGQICDEYAQKDSRIQVIHKMNGGLSAARNTGYENAIGEWITFLDGDDWIEPQTCEDTYRIGIENKADIVIFGTVQEFDHYKNPFQYHYVNGTIFEGEQCRALQCEILNFTGNIATAWAKLFNRNFLKDRKLEHNAELRQGSEGIEFNIRVFEKVQKVYFTDKIYYHYIFNPNSISAKHDEKNHHFVIKCFEEIRRQIEISDNSVALTKLFYNRFAYVVVAAAISGYFSPTNKTSYSEQKKGFSKYVHQELVLETLEKCNTLEIDIQRRLVIQLIRRELYLPVKILAYLRYRQKRGGKSNG